MKNFLPFISLLTILLAGCASAGTQVDPAAAAQIQKGRTTKAEVMARLGPPIADSLMADGREMLVWAYAHTQMKGATFIPVVGLFAGGANTKTTTFQVILNQQKIVEDCLWSNSAIDSRMGQ